MALVRAGVLGHWGANIGHDIMALGVETALQAAFGARLECVRIEQHRPLEIYPQRHLLRRARFLQHGQGGRLARPLKSLVNMPAVSARLWRDSWVGELNLGIACGGPLITPQLAYGDLGLMFHHMLGAFGAHAVPMLNLSIGSCFPWEKLPTTVIDRRNRIFLSRMFEYSKLSTTRDHLAQRLCADLGVACELLPDTGFIAGDGFLKLAPAEPSPKYVVVNYQKYGANEDWGQGVEAHTWARSLSDLVAQVGRRHEVVLVCHSDYESQLARTIAPTARHFQPRNLTEYAQVAAGAVAGVTNRIHAAVTLASVGAPVVAVGTDSRLGTLQTLQIPTYYVKDVTTDVLEMELERMIANRASEHERLTTLRNEALARYVQLLRDAVGQ